MASSFEEPQHRVFRPPAFLGESRALLPAFVQLGRLAGTNAPLLLLGEPGTGKALLARLVHDHSARRDEPFTVVAADEPLVAPERGTLFIDEVTALTARDQLALLALVSSSHDRTKAGATGRAVRVIAASAAPETDTIWERVPAWRLGAFRRGIITLPPLRRRSGDVGRLAMHFAMEWAAETGLAVPRLTPESVRLLESCRWQGNVPELRAVLRRALDATGPTGRIEPHTIRRFLPLDAHQPAEGPDSMPTLRELRRAHIHRAVAASGGDLDAAARALGIERAVLARILRHVARPVADRRAARPVRDERPPEDPARDSRTAP